MVKIVKSCKKIQRIVVIKLVLVSAVRFSRKYDRAGLEKVMFSLTGLKESNYPLQESPQKSTVVFYVERGRHTREVLNVDLYRLCLGLVL